MFNIKNHLALGSLNFKLEKNVYLIQGILKYKVERLFCLQLMITTELIELSNLGNLYKGFCMVLGYFLLLLTFRIQSFKTLVWLKQTVFGQGGRGHWTMFLKFDNHVL